MEISLQKLEGIISHLTTSLSAQRWHSDKEKKRLSTEKNRRQKKMAIEEKVKQILDEKRGHESTTFTVAELNTLLGWYNIPKLNNMNKEEKLEKWKEICSDGKQPPKFDKWTDNDENALKEASKETETGYEGTNIYRNFLLTSDDDGVTWSAPLDVTRTTKRPTRATTICSGPGIGIQLTRGAHKGRLIFRFNEGPFWLWQNFSVFSDDAGKTWHTGVDAGTGRDWDWQIVWNRPLHPENAGNYYDRQILSFNGEERMTDGYSTDNYTEWAVECIRGQHRDPPKPWKRGQ